MMRSTLFARVFVGLLLALLCTHASGESILGLLRSPDGVAIAGGSVRAVSPAGTTLAVSSSDNNGRFRIDGLGQGGVWLWVEAPGFDSRGLWLTPAWPQPVDVRLQPATLRTSVTVTANRSRLEEEEQAIPFVSARESSDFWLRSANTVAHAAESAPGVVIQQTTPGQASPFLRGFTGYHTLLLVDGIRLNTSIFRSGPNQYLAFVPLTQADAVETVLGPSSSQYGSDALGGTINVISRKPSWSEEQGIRHALEWGQFYESGDLGMRQSAQYSGASKAVAWLLSGAWNRHNNLRTGEGVDSHNVFTRYFGLSGDAVSKLLGSRLLDTAFTHLGMEGRISWKPSSRSVWTGSFQHGEILGLRSYRDQLGGLGRVQARSEPQSLDLLYSRFEQRGALGLDSLTGTVSWNGQRDDSLRQGSRRSDRIQEDGNRVDALGLSVAGVRNLGSLGILHAGMEVYREAIGSTRSDLSPFTGERRELRAQYPNGSRYTNWGWFMQGDLQLPSQPWRLSAGLRATRVGFQTFASENLDSQGRSLGVTDQSLAFTNLSYHAALDVRVLPWLWVEGISSTGFRAPNLNDLGTMGLTGLGFEVPAREAIRAGAVFGQNASESALPSSRPIVALGAETIRNSELGFRVHAGRVYARAHGFYSSLRNPIVRRTVLFPDTAVPDTVAGIPVVPVAQTEAQKQAGVTMVATEHDPRGLKAFVNDGRSRYLGVEALLRLQLTRAWTWENGYHYLSARDLQPNRYVRRLPPQQGSSALRYAPASRPFWGEIQILVHGTQTLLSGGDLDDERIGASRRRNDIASFFRYDVVAPYISAGSDGTIGTSDDLFTPTGETLRQIQDRVLPLGTIQQGVLIVNDNTRAPLYRETPGWVRFDIRGGYRLNSRWQLFLGVQNLADRNYRVHGSGIDGAGRSFFVGARAIF